MNLSLPHPPATPSPYTIDERGQRDRHLRVLLSLLALYTATLLIVIVLPDDADVACILAGIGGHILYASTKTLLAWREATWLEAARNRVLRRRLA